MFFSSSQHVEEPSERWLAPLWCDAFKCIRNKTCCAVCFACCKDFGTSYSTSFYIPVQMTGVICLTFCPASLSRCLGAVEGSDRVPRCPAARSALLPSYLLFPCRDFCLSRPSVWPLTLFLKAFGLLVLFCGFSGSLAYLVRSFAASLRGRAF